jgi:hypothetical protein
VKVSIHQPNYLPWLGYFYKIALADVFVFLDDVQFSKGSYTNRVKILSPSGPKWLTIPVKASLGQAIQEVGFANPAWRASHVDVLTNAYAAAPAFDAVWPEIKEAILGARGRNLAEVNIDLVAFIAERLGLHCKFRRSSEFQIRTGSDDRLIEITAQVAPRATYLSGSGGAKYQDPEKFLRARLGFAYASYSPLAYMQLTRPGQPDFVPGLSVLDAVLYLGWGGAAELLQVSHCDTTASA